MTQIYAVFTGDLTGSRHNASALEATMRLLSQTCDTLGRLFELDLRFTRYRGDGWQIILPAHLLLEASLALLSAQRALPQALDTRIGIGVGSVTHLGSENLSDAMGEAFLAAGDTLDALTGTSRTLGLSGSAAPQTLAGSLDIVDWMAQGWTSHQSEAIAVFLLQPEFATNKARAAALGISRQAYEARFNSSGFPALKALRKAIKEMRFEADPE
ncbi:hypothetical protein [Algirhabdus cladophorae]|uniref:hypothetical protein n=1 Tax=Algirhabdus cladophorae TaxID=3377108 RepID=UPI003B847A1D